MQVNQYVCNTLFFFFIQAGQGGVRQRQYTGLVDCLTKTVKSDGLRGIYRGYGPSVGTQFTCFTGTKVQILTPEELQLASSSTERATSGSTISLRYAVYLLC
jgi:hypothetical protein